MKRLKKRSGLLATAIAVFAFPCAATADYLVPPSNSAATQYTEAFPTADGNRETNRAREGERSPAKALGSRNAGRLEAQGETGREAAEVAAATAPSIVAVEAKVGEGTDAGTTIVEPEGSSALGETIAHAAGVSALGETGAFLPLVVLGAIAWAIAHLWRQRRPAP